MTLMRPSDRRTALSFFRTIPFRPSVAMAKVAGSFIVALVVAWLSSGGDLSPAGVRTLFVVALAAGLWLTEAVPAFAVGLLVIALQVILLGRPGGVFAEGPNDWQIFIAPWSSPLIWLFFGGFVLAEAGRKTGLDRWFSRVVLVRVGSKPGRFLMGVMGIVFIFSMFMSNTATAAMMLAVMTPALGSLPEASLYRKALLLGVAFAANIGGMGTIIGTPPNAIAVGALADVAPVSFLGWMAIGLPPAIVLLVLLWAMLMIVFPGRGLRINLSSLSEGARSSEPQWRVTTVAVVFALTVALWMTGTLHGLPTPVVSFLPLTVFTMLGVLTADDIRGLPWDVLLLITGGLSLGVGVSETGLATWLVDQLPTEGLSLTAVTASLAMMAMILSNFMSNTAAANILIPLGMAMAVGRETSMVAPLALACSSAMCLPISTPPNAIVFSSGELRTRDFVFVGAVMGFAGAGLGALWCAVVL